ncbi:MAG: hypothetical protein U0Y68_03330 [Blastocatellia bacterium]
MATKKTAKTKRTQIKDIAITSQELTAEAAEKVRGGETTSTSTTSLPPTTTTTSATGPRKPPVIGNTGAEY